MASEIKQSHADCGGLIYSDDQAPGGAGAIAARAAARVAWLVELNLVVGDVPILVAAGPAATAAEKADYLVDIKLHESKKERRKKAQTAASGAIALLLSRVEAQCLLRLRATAVVVTAIDGSDLAALWDSIPAAVQGVGGARLLAAAAALEALSTTKMRTGETLGAYVERLRVARSVSASYGNAAQDEPRMAYAFVSGLSTDYNGFKSMAGVADYPNLQAAVTASMAWVLPARAATDMAGDISALATGGGAATGSVGAPRGGGGRGRRWRRGQGLDRNGQRPMVLDEARKVPEPSSALRRYTSEQWAQLSRAEQRQVMDARELERQKEAKRKAGKNIAAVASSASATLDESSSEDDT